MEGLSPWTSSAILMGRSLTKEVTGAPRLGRRVVQIAQSILLGLVNPVVGAMLTLQSKFHLDGGGYSLAGALVRRETGMPQL